MRRFKLIFVCLLVIVGCLPSAFAGPSRIVMINGVALDIETDDYFVKLSEFCEGLSNVKWDYDTKTGVLYAAKGKKIVGFRSGVAQKVLIDEYHPKGYTQSTYAPKGEGKDMMVSIYDLVEGIGGWGNYNIGANAYDMKLPDVSVLKTKVRSNSTKALEKLPDVSHSDEAINSYLHQPWLQKKDGTVVMTVGHAFKRHFSSTNWAWYPDIYGRTVLRFTGKLNAAFGMVLSIEYQFLFDSNGNPDIVYFEMGGKEQTNQMGTQLLRERLETDKSDWAKGML